MNGYADEVASLYAGMDLQKSALAPFIYFAWSLLTGGLGPP